MFTVMEGKCVTYDRFGIPEQVLRVENKIVRRPGTGEMLVRMTSRPVNPSDLIPIGGAYAHRIRLPAVPGYEGVGIVQETGPGVSREWIGKRVLPLRGEGTWQQYVIASADLAVQVPDSVNDDTAAQLYINPVTAWVTCTEILGLKPNDTVVVNACGSSIGRIYAQLSRILGFRLIAVTRSRIHTEELLAFGASTVVHTTDPLGTDLHHAVMEHTNGAGASAAIDSVGGGYGTALAYGVRPGGILLSIGLLSGQPLAVGEIAQRTKAKLMLFHLRHWNKQASVEAWQHTFRQLIALTLEKRLIIRTPSVRYDLSEVTTAVRDARLTETGGGKILLTG